MAGFSGPRIYRSDLELTELGWRAVARDSEGYVVSLMAPGFFDDYLEWIGEMEGRGHAVVELPTQNKEG